MHHLHFYQISAQPNFKYGYQAAIFENQLRAIIGQHGQSALALDNISCLHRWLNHLTEIVRQQLPVTWQRCHVAVVKFLCDISTELRLLRRNKTDWILVTNVRNDVPLKLLVVIDVLDRRTYPSSDYFSSDMLFLSFE
jgi:hypothetical protein